MSVSSARATAVPVFISALTMVVVLALSGEPSAAGEALRLRVGHFPNITHLQALVAHNLSRQGKGWFEARVPDLAIDWFVYNAGPGAVEAIFANSIDLTYVGPNPAINAYVKSHGEEVRIVAGAADGGTALVVQSDLPFKMAADFKGRKIATPEFGNTQDVSARAWLVAGGLRITQTGGDAFVVPTANPDQLALFKTHQLDAVWTVEPWVSRLEIEAGGKVLVDDRETVTTVLVASVRALATRRDLIRRFVAAHNELTDWINANRAEALKLARAEIEAETHVQIGEALIERATKRIVFTAAVTRSALEIFLKSAQSVGFLRGATDLAKLVEAP